ncbi:preprotein translocase subunit SecE [Buchnera aphidicola (Rhopalosiphum padi)]|uniref:Protein translocase subunit SecE n=1 Tax=Buchnera aphidicola subsp. Rhopalosiphum padi TaxID=98793 RepID=A0A4D6YFM9_BUCRP|nr:preprotein translocase subunit SecE [Buchnera aphidicola]QCI24704.1 preprotein translocase subunit SecE [Buchnera aphidicola (Rhopalosiphum padi)]
MKIRIPNQKKTKNLEKIKWFFIILILITSFFIHIFFDKIGFFTRTSIITLLVGFAIGIAIYTKRVKDIFLYINASKNEMKKIIWPQYKETLYTTFIIISVTIVISLFLWGLDSIIFRLIAFIISLRF